MCKVMYEAVSLLVLCSVPLSLLALMWDVTWGDSLANGASRHSVITMPSARRVFTPFVNVQKVNILYITYTNMLLHCIKKITELQDGSGWKRPQ